MISAAAAIARQRANAIILISTNSSFSSSPSIQKIQKRTVFSKFAVPDYDKHRPAPWPYRERGYNYLHKYIDFGVTKRLGENSKLIIVEGNVGSGKSEIAKQLADRLGFFHIPDPPIDDLMVDSYGEDRRLYYHLIPETTREFDTRMFFEQPRHRNVAEYQRRRFFYRVEAYLNALTHILNTGQGVVLERHWQTDSVFVEAMYKKGYLSDVFRHTYYKRWFKTLQQDILLDAHLVVYLDCPVSKCLENIKKNHKPYTWKNEVLDYGYLETIEQRLKFWLDQYKREAEILVYDWTNGGDAITIAEDIEQIDLDSYNPYKNQKFESWHYFPHEIAFNDYRHKLTNRKFDDILRIITYPVVACEELWTPPDDQIHHNYIHNLLYGKYSAGYKPEKGDSIWKMMISFEPLHDQVSNNNWTEYYLRDAHHRNRFDMLFTGFSEPGTPTFPEELLQPRSPYKSDGGCMAHAHLFMDEHGHLIHDHH